MPLVPRPRPRRTRPSFGIKLLETSGLVVLGLVLASFGWFGGCVASCGSSVARDAPEMADRDTIGLAAYASPAVAAGGQATAGVGQLIQWGSSISLVLVVGLLVRVWWRPGPRESDDAAEVEPDPPAR